MFYLRIHCLCDINLELGVCFHSLKNCFSEAASRAPQASGGPRVVRRCRGARPPLPPAAGQRCGGGKGPLDLPLLQRGKGRGRAAAAPVQPLPQASQAAKGRQYIRSALRKPLIGVVKLINILTCFKGVGGGGGVRGFNEMTPSVRYQ
jgi:hypothetical protein